MYTRRVLDVSGVDAYQLNWNQEFVEMPCGQGGISSVGPVHGV